SWKWRRMLPAGLAVLALGGPAHSQNLQSQPQSQSQSLGDLARQVRKDKAADAASHRVITNDDIGGSPSSGNSLGLSGTTAPSADKPVSLETAQRAIENVDAKMKQLDAMDRVTLETCPSGAGSRFPWPPRLGR